MADYSAFKPPIFIHKSMFQSIQYPSSLELSPSCIIVGKCNCVETRQSVSFSLSHVLLFPKCYLSVATLKSQQNTHLVTALFPSCFHCFSDFLLRWFGDCASGCFKHTKELLEQAKGDSPEESADVLMRSNKWDFTTPSTDRPERLTKKGCRKNLWIVAEWRHILHWSLWLGYAF